MDQIREIFYWTATIALILFSIFVIALVVLLAYIKRLADHGMRKLDDGLARVSGAARTWKNLAFTRIIIRALRILI